MQNVTKNFKCIVVGDGVVGKTSLLLTYTTNAFPAIYFPTFSNKTVIVMVDGRPVNVTLWDYQGQSNFDTSRRLFVYPQTDVVLLLFSLIQRNSYANVSKKWIGDLRHHCPGAPIVLVGTKLDLRAVNVPSFEQGHISTKEGKALAKRIGAVCYLECSALTHQNVNAVFDVATRLVVLGSTGLSKKWFSFHLAILDQLPAKLQLISRIQNSMDDLLKHLKICYTRSEYLITKSQQRSKRIQDWFSERSADPYLGNLNRATVMGHNWDSVFFCLNRFISCMVAGEDLLSYCAKEDWKTVALSLFLPTSCESTCSKFFLVTRDLDWAADMLFNLLEAPTAPKSSGINDKAKAKMSLGTVFQKFLRRSTRELQPENDYVEAETIRDYFCKHASDREDVLLKLESESSNPSSDLKIYGPLLRKRLQGEPPAEGASLVPNCFWIPGKLQYEYQDVAGTGSSKTVLKCTWLGQDVAIAIYGVAKSHFELEAGVLARVQHPNVVNFIACAYENMDQKGYHVTELMEQDLRQLITKSLRGDGQMPFSLSVSMDIILQIVEAMIHMRKCRVSHRDLKPQNCLVSMKKTNVQEDLGDQYYVVKLIDFGSAKLHHPDTSICETRKQGSTAYMAPELHKRKEDCQYTWSADVYSFGMTCYEIMSGKYPFEGECEGGDLVTRVCAGKRPQFSESCPVFWKQLIEKCWHPIPERRPSFISIRKEIWECYDKLVSE